VGVCVRTCVRTCVRVCLCCLRCDSVCVTFSVVPHITDAIQEWVERVAKVPVDGDSREPDVCIIEVNSVRLELLYLR